MTGRKQKLRKNHKPLTRKELTDAVKEYLKEGGKITQLVIEDDCFADYMKRTGRFCDDIHDFLNGQ